MLGPAEQSQAHHAIRGRGGRGPVRLDGYIRTSHEVPTADFVVKPVTGGASTLIAERVLSRVAGAARPDSQTVRRTSDGGRGIIHWIDAMVQDDPSKADKFQGFESAEKFMLHNMTSEYMEMSKRYTGVENAGGSGR